MALVGITPLLSLRNTFNLFGLIKRFIPFFRFKTVSDKDLAASLTNITGLKPKNLELYKQAFLHSSKGVKKTLSTYNNERLEFLGDAILGAIIADYLFKKYPNKNEGFLTQIRSKIVNRQHLHQLALKFGLDAILKTNLSKQDKLKSSAYGDAFEALIGAMYMDLGYDSTTKFVINKIIKLHVNLDELISSDTDYKSQIQIYCQKNKLDLSYNAIEELPKGKNKFYRVNVVINETSYEPFEHFSKKIAEQKAAQLALEKISNG